jgi:two-component system sensor histidine kinase EvgS
MDISAQKEFEAKLESSKTKAEESDKLKSEFIANMSHEIRTPMNSILGFTDILERKNKDQKLNEYIEAIKVGGQTLLMLINNLLDLSKIEAGKLKIDYSPVDLKLLLSQIEMLFKHQAKSKGINLAFSTPFFIPHYVLIDELRVRQLLINLVGNAIKFTEKGSVTVKLEITERTANDIDIKFLVEDTGIGIKKTETQRIFKAFEQHENNDSKRYEGAGLGLTISNKLATLINSKIKVKSHFGKGSTFSFKLNKVSIKQKYIASPKTTEDKTEQFMDYGSILLIDRKQENIALLKETLCDFNFTFHQSSNPKEALRWAENKMPDIIFSPIKTSDIKTWKVATIIKTNTLFKHLPIIGIKDAISLNKQNSPAEHDFDFIINKPITLNKISKVLIQITKNHQETTTNPNANNKYQRLKTKIPLLPLDTKNEIVDILNQLSNRNSMKSYNQLACVLLETANNSNIPELNEIGMELKNKINSFNIMDAKTIIQTISRIFS